MSTGHTSEDSHNQHSHSHVPSPHSDRRYLWAGLVILCLFMLAEVIIAWFSGSLALLSDAGHMLSDVGALALALWVSYIAEHPAHGTWTYGFRRAEVLSGMVNAITMLIVAAIIITEAIHRLVTPSVVVGAPVMWTALAGIVVNLVVTGLLAKADRTSLNIRGAYQHVVTDLYGFIGTVIAGIVIMFTGWMRADSLASLLVAALMVHASVPLLRDGGRVLLEACPAHISPEEIRTHLLECDHVEDVHDLHVWTIDSGTPLVSAHVSVADEADAQNYHDVLDTLQECLREHFNITHSTFQCEPAHHAAHEETLHH